MKFGDAVRYENNGRVCYGKALAVTALNVRVWWERTPRRVGGYVMGLDSSWLARCSVTVEKS